MTRAARGPKSGAMDGADPRQPEAGLDALRDNDLAFAAWRALAEKTLKGAPLASLTSCTADSLPIEPLYPPGRHAPVALDWGDRDLDRPWDVRGLVAHPTPQGCNAQALDDLQGGAHSILLTLDPAGRTGLAAGGAADLARALESVHTDLAPVALDAGFQGVDAALWLSAAAKGAPNAPLAFHLDPLSAFAVTGESPGPVDAWLAQAAGAARALHDVHPRASLFLASGRAVHEAGGTEGQELAFMLASALAYAKACEAAGLARGAALPRIVLGPSADPRPLVTIAKLRAARLLWGKLSATLGAPCRAVIEARGSLRMLSTLDAWTNLIRLTAAGFGAAAGGADALVLQPFTAPFGGLPGALARRQARNTQLVLMEETGLGRVADPGEGSGVIEALTEGFARKAWEGFQAIEAEGGAVSALTCGSNRFAREVAAARLALEAQVADGTIVLIGVTKFVNAADAGVPVKPWPQSAVAGRTARPDDDPAPPLPPVRLAERAEVAAGKLQS